MQSYLFKADGEIKKLSPKADEGFNIEDLNELVDGFAQIIPVTENNVIVVNEENMLQKESKNINVSKMMMKDMFGDILFCHKTLIR